MHTLQQIKQIYIDDLRQLSLVEDYHGKRKVRNAQHWDNVESHSNTGITEFVDLTAAYAAGRKILCWSDLHISHKNIIKYADRPFADIPSMNEHFVRVYNTHVQPNDIVIFGGDIGFIPPHVINTDYLQRMPGYKILILGNHDITRDGKPYPLAFDEIHVANFIDLPNGNTVLITHIPVDTLPANMYNLHGHLHQHIRAGNRHRSMCVEHVNYKPTNITDILNGFAI